MARQSSVVRTALQSPSLFALPAIAFVGAFAIWPMLVFMGESLFSGDRFSFVQFQRLWNSETFFDVLRHTLVTAITVTLICLVLAYPLAYALTKARGRVRTVLMGLVVLPYLTSVIVRTYAWAAILSLRGPVNIALLSLGVLREPMLLGHSEIGTQIGMVHILLPIAVLTIWSGLQKIDPLHWTAAATLGASRSATFFTVYLPQSAAGLRSAASLVYILALGAYVIPQTLGSTRGLLFAQLVVEQATSLLNWNLAAAMAAVMLIAAGVPALILMVLLRLRSGIARGRAIGAWQSFFSRHLQPPLDCIPAKVWTLGWKFAATAVILFLLLPEVVVVAISFGPERQITFPPAYWTLDGYGHTLSDPSWMEPLLRSAIFSVIDGVCAVLLGALAAYGFARTKPVIATIGIGLLVLPIVLPEIVTAISYFIFASRLGLAGTALGIILGQGAAAVGLVVVMMSAIVRQLDLNLELAAEMCGAGKARMIREIVFPLIAPGLLVSFLYGFLYAFDNLVLPLFISGTELTVTVRMFLSLQEELTSAPAVVASLLIAMLAVALASSTVLARKSPMQVPLIG